MRVLVCGGRAYGDAAKVFGMLDELHWRRPITQIIQGGAAGADAIARAWAETAGVKVRTYTGVRTESGKSSWSKGNQRMLDEGKPQLVVAFPGVRRTADMVRRAKRAEVTVLEVFADAADCHGDARQRRK
jgi:hypothetical protein